MDIIKTTREISWSTFTMAACGYVYGKIFKLEKKAVVTAFAIYGFAAAAIHYVAIYAVGGTRITAVQKNIFNPRSYEEVPVNPRSYALITQTCGSIMSFVALVALRQLNIIATWGTLYFATDAVFRAYEVWRITKN